MIRKNYTIKWTKKVNFSDFEERSTTIPAHVIEDAITCLRSTEPDIYEIVSCVRESIVPISDADMLSIKN